MTGGWSRLWIRQRGFGGKKQKNRSRPKWNGRGQFFKPPTNAAMGVAGRKTGIGRAKHKPLNDPGLP